MRNYTVILMVNSYNKTLAVSVLIKYLEIYDKNIHNNSIFDIISEGNDDVYKEYPFCMMDNLEVYMRDEDKTKEQTTIIQIG